MKRKLTQSALALFLMLTFSGCGVTCVEPLPGEGPATANTDQLTGEWEWIKTYNGWGGWETPASKGQQETLILGAGGDFKRLKNGALGEAWHYYVSNEKSTVPGKDSTLFLHLVDKNKGIQVTVQPLYRIGPDTIRLHLAEVCFDCPELYYVRRQPPATTLAR